MSTAEELVHTMHANDRERTALRLYDIADELLAIEDELYENGGDLSDELEARLAALEGSLESKVERICGLIQHNIRGAEAAKAEAQRLAQLASTRDNVARSLKNYLLRTLQALGRPKLETARFKVRIQANSRPSIQWPGDVNAIPEPFKRVTVELNGNAAYDAWRQTKELPEGFTVETGSHLRIS